MRLSGHVVGEPEHLKAVQVGAYRTPRLHGLPVSWAMAGSSPFLLEDVPAGRYHLLACYCHRRMERPGDFSTAFAWGRAAEPVLPGESDHTIHLRDGSEW